MIFSLSPFAPENLVSNSERGSTHSFSSDTLSVSHIQYMCTYMPTVQIL